MAFSRWMILGAAMLVALAGAACARHEGGADEGRTVRKGGGFVTEEVTQKGGFFYRLQAYYTVKETGEPIEFDFVVACNIRTTNYSYTGPSFVAERYPEVMAKATKDGHAVMIKTPRICQQIQLDRHHVPDDYVPFAIWFDDVNDLSFGWGYATQDAYEGPRAKIAYRPTDSERGTYTAKLTRVTRADWEAWRKKAAENWVQVGALPGPWGYSLAQDKAGLVEQKRVEALNGGKRIGDFCNSVERLSLDAAAADIYRKAVNNDSRFLDGKRFVIVDFDPKLIAAEHDVFELGKVEPIYDGHTWKALWPVQGTRLKAPAVGSILTTTSSSPREPGQFELYPLLQYFEPPYLTFGKEGYVRQLLFGPEWRGLAACGFSSGKAAANKRHSASATSVDPRLPADVLNLESRIYPIYLNDRLFVPDAGLITGTTSDFPRLFELSGFYWSRSPAPGG